MSSITPRDLRRRDDTGRTFSFIFAIVAVLVLLGCLIWGILLPKFRKKIRDRESRQRGLPLYRTACSPPRFPSHPALLRGFAAQHPHPRIVQRYDPRTESPFPNPPPPAFEFHSIRSQAQDSETDSSDVLMMSDVGLRRKRSAGAEPRQALQNGGRDPRTVAEWHDQDDYILPVPEPAVLKPRMAGRPPPLARQLEKFPMPFGSGARGGFVHPTKLFQELEERDSKSTSGTFGTPCPVPQHSDRTAGAKAELGIAFQSHGSARKPEDARPLSENEAHCSSDLATAEEPRTLRQTSGESDGNQKGKQKQQTNLERAGTLTRPKTPVAEICDLFNRAASANKAGKTVIKKVNTPSTNPFTTPAHSSTAPTSPPFSPAQPAPPPFTPLDMMDSRAFRMRRPVENQIRQHMYRRTPSSVILQSPEEIARLTQYERFRGENGKPEAASQEQELTTLSEPEDVKYGPLSNVRPGETQPASSIYSRDTKGLTYLERADHHNALNGSQAFDLGLRTHTQMPAGRYDGPSQAQPSTSANPLQTKIDDWDLHTGDLDASFLAPSTRTRSFSDRGFPGPNLPVVPRQTKAKAPSRDQNGNIATPAIPLIRLGRPSDDIFGIEAHGTQSSNVKKRSEQTEPRVVNTNGRISAPGRGAWI